MRPSESRKARRARPDRTADARALRGRLSLPEVLLWTRLRRSQFRGLAFRRQHPIGSFIADFYCHQAALVVEVDGAAHFTAQRFEMDRARDAWMQGLGLRVVRIPARVVLQDMESALALIERAVGTG